MLFIFKKNCNFVSFLSFLFEVFMIYMIFNFLYSIVFLRYIYFFNEMIIYKKKNSNTAFQKLNLEK